jgi:hypothetical protein
MRKRGLCVLVAAIAGIAPAGCGGPMKADELQRGIDTLGSTAIEGELLAGDIGNDRTKATFARVYARELGERVTHEAEKLADAQARPSLAKQQGEAVELAGDISDQLSLLQVHPGSQAVGRQAKLELKKLSDRASDLSDQL